MAITDVILIFSKDDRLPNLDATEEGAYAENNNEEDIVPTRERKHFPSNITKIGYVIFSVSYSYPVTQYTEYRVCIINTEIFKRKMFCNFLNNKP